MDRQRIFTATIMVALAVAVAMGGEGSPPVLRPIDAEAVGAKPLQLDAPEPADLPKPKFKKVKRITNLLYLGEKTRDKQRQALDIYQPVGAADAPVLLFAHGGAWRMGDRDNLPIRQAMNAFAQQGIVAVSVGYRLTPKVTHPAHVEDVAAAFAWVHEHIGQYGGRADRIFLSGHSAGGHLVSLIASDPKYLTAHKLGLEAIAAVIPISGVYQLDGAQKLPRHYKWLSEMVTATFGDKREQLQAASPLHHAVKGRKLPPFRIVFGEKDPGVLALQALAFCRKLADAGVDARWMTVPGRGHEGVIFALGNDKDPTTLMMLDYIARRTAALDKAQQEARNASPTSQPDEESREQADIAGSTK